METKNSRPVFAKRIFWDVDVDKLDFDNKEEFVIVRVFERGDVEDIRTCRRYYGDEKVSHVLLNTKFLSEQSLFLAAAVINKDEKEFKCYKFRQSNPQLYPY